MKKAVIFDMDGVIIDSERYWSPMLIDFLLGLSKELTPKKIKKLTGIAVDRIYDYLKEDYHIKISYKEFIAKFDQAAQSIYNNKTKIYPGFFDVVENLKRQGYILAIASSSKKDWINMAIKRFNLNRYFEFIVSVEEVNGKSKPNPDIYLFTAKKLKIHPTECTAIEDTKHGVMAAKNAGMRCIGFQSSANQDLSQADLVIKKFSEFNIESLDGKN